MFSIQSQRQIKNYFTVQFKNIWYQLDKIQPTVVYKKDNVLVEERLDSLIHLSKKEKYLNFKKLPAKLEKIKTKLVAFTPNKAPWIPPTNHPWRKQISDQFRQRQLIHNS